MKIGIIFPGYGTQFVGMGKEFYDEFRIVQEYFEEAYNCLNTNFIKLCFASSETELSKLTNAYPSIFLLSSSLIALLKENGIKPDVVAGYGIGNYSAIFAANGLTFPDGLYLLKKFASFCEENLQNMNVGILCVEGISTAKLKKLCDKYNSVQICVYNTASQFLISGSSSEINEIKNCLNDLNAKTKKIDFGNGLNSILMNDIIHQFQVYLEKVDFKDLEIPLLNCIDSKEINSGKKIKKYIIKQINSPIKWNKVIDKLSDVDLIIEVGPGNSLAEFVKEKYPDKKIVSLNNKSDLEEIKKIVSTQEVINSVDTESIQKESYVQ